MDDHRPVPRPEPPQQVPPQREAEGGDPACWANRVCAECGRLNGAERPVVCEACGARFDQY